MFNLPFKMRDTNESLQSNPDGPTYEVKMERAGFCDGESDWMEISFFSPDGKKYGITFGINEGKPAAFLYHPEDQQDCMAMKFEKDGISLEHEYVSHPVVKKGYCKIQIPKERA